MTLLEMATISATKARRQNDSDSITLAKTFIQNRYKTIYADGLWRDSLMAMEINFKVSGTPDSFNTVVLNTAGYYLFPPLVERLIALRTTASGMSIAMSEDVMMSEPEVFTKTGEPLAYEILSPVVAMWTTPLYMQVIATSAADSGLSSKLVYIRNGGIRDSCECPLSITDQPVEDDVIELERWSKPVTAGSIRISDLLSSDTHATLEADETYAQPKVRVRIFPKPLANTTARALVKKRMIPLVDDNDAPELRGVDECLIAFGYAELLRYERRGDAASSADQEALALLNQLRESNTWVESSTRRIVPASIYEAEPIEAKGYW